MLLHDQLPPQRNHEQHAEPPAQQRQRKNSPERKLRSKSQKYQRRNREHHPRRQRFPRRPRRLHNIIFKNRRAPKRPQNTDRQHRNRNRRRHRQPSPQPHINRHRAKQQPEQRPQHHRAQSKLSKRLLRRHIRLKFPRRRRRTPSLIRNRQASPPKIRAPVTAANPRAVAWQSRITQATPSNLAANVRQLSTTRNPRQAATTVGARLRRARAAHPTPAPFIYAKPAPTVQPSTAHHNHRQFFLHPRPPNLSS